jgi:hypothetical protein
MNNKKGNKLTKQQYVTMGFIIILFSGISCLIGFLAGTTVVMPDEIDLYTPDIEEFGNNLENFSLDLKNLSKDFGFACANISHTCDCKLDMGPESLKYVIDQYEEVMELKRTNYRKIDTFCKRSNQIGTLHMHTPETLYVLELNEPIEVLNWTFEIVGADSDCKGFSTDWKDYIIMDINGARKKMSKDECFTNGEVTICARDLFIYNIPYLGASGYFDIYENKGVE